MKTIKVFIASSKELHEERLAIPFLFQQLNRDLKSKGIAFEPVKWEYLDASMGPLHKQEEYNIELKTCEICIALFWTRFGEYTKSEFETAYHEMLAGRNPRKLIVYFKDAEEISPDLKVFKDSFATEYGQFSFQFESLKTLRLNIILQLLDYTRLTDKDLPTVYKSIVEMAIMQDAESNNARQL